MKAHDLPLFIGLMALASAACTPGGVKYLPLHPVPDSSVVTADRVIPLIEGVDTATLDVEALRHIVVLATDSIAAAFALFEFRDLYYLDLYVYNGQRAALDLSLESLILLDANRMQARRLQPHQAANVFLAEVRGATPYQPKYTYYVNTYTYGNYSTSTVYAQEDGAAALGYAIGSAIRRKRNRKLREMADALYALGLVDGTVVAADATLRVGACWARTGAETYPLRLRFTGNGYEINFRQAR